MKIIIGALIVGYFLVLQLIDYLTAYGLEEEGILRVPGSTTRIKVLFTDILKDGFTA